MCHEAPPWRSPCGMGGSLELERGRVPPSHFQATKDPNTKDAEVEVEQDPLTGGRFVRLIFIAQLPAGRLLQSRLCKHRSCLDRIARTSRCGFRWLGFAT